MTQPGLLPTGGVLLPGGATKSKPSNGRPQEGEIELLSRGGVAPASIRPNSHLSNNQPHGAHPMVCLDISSQPVSGLVASLFLKERSSARIFVQEIGEGASNCVYGITITPVGRDRRKDSGADLKSFDDLKTYVIRVPYDRDFIGKELELELMREIVTLEVIGPRLSRLSVPTPRVLNYDVTSNKALEGPFTLQTRLRGDSLAEIWDGLKPSQRRSAMQQIIQIIEKIASITAHAGGSISTENLEFPNSSNIEIERFLVPGRLDPVAIGFEKAENLSGDASVSRHFMET
jgi:hypothetical protein